MNTISRPEKKLIAIDTDKVDKDLKPFEMKLYFSDGTTEICDSRNPDFAGRTFQLGGKEALQ